MIVIKAIYTMNGDVEQALLLLQGQEALPSFSPAEDDLIRANQLDELRALYSEDELQDRRQFLLGK